MQANLNRAVVLGVFVILTGCGGGGGSSGGGTGASGGGSGSAGGGTASSGGGTSSTGGGSASGGGSGGGAPQTTIGSGPTKISGTGTASFTFSCDQASCTFECAFDQAAFAACTSPASKMGLPEGMHRFAVRASGGGLTDPTPATADFTVDATAPVVTFTAKPPASQVNTHPSVFSFTCSESPCTTSCSLDGAAYTACTSPLTLDAVAAGAHTLSVRAKDEVGNEGTDGASWSLTFGWRRAAANSTTACAVSGDRKLYCWGSDAQGMLGVGGPVGQASPNAKVPQRVGTDATWDTVAAGLYLMCATNTAGEKFCWGSNGYRQFGDPAVGANDAKTAPFKVTRAIGEASLGVNHACGLDAAGALYCWGDGSDGNLGDGNTASHLVATPTRIGSATWKSVSASGHTCGIQTDGSLWCFGYNESGESGVDPMTAAVGVPTRVGTANDWASVSAGRDTTCAVKSNGTAWCFGTNGQGALGNGSSLPDPVFTPVQVGTATTWSSVTVMDLGACGVQTDGTVWCWGTNERGEIGSLLQADHSATPVQVTLNDKARAVVGNSALRCALTVGDGLWCWGENVSANGGLGRGVNGIESMPVGLDTGYSSIAITSNDYGGTAIGGCGIKSGQLLCWGVGRHLGVAGTSLSLHPIPVTADTDWTSVQMTATSIPISGGGSTNTPLGHVCALRSAGLYCWGANASGQLGNGQTVGSATPLLVPPPASDTWSTVAVGVQNTCATTTSGKLYCWGDNSGGQLADGTLQSKSVPTRVGTTTDWSQVSIYGNRVTGRRIDGTLWVWGQGATSLNAFDNGTDWLEGRTGSNFSCGRKTNGTMHCKILGFAVKQVGTATDITRMFDFDNGTCFQHATGAIECTQYDGTNWGPAMFPVVPAGLDWIDFQWRTGFACGLKSGGQRFCRGTRFAGSFGDDFESRLPAAVTTP